MKRINKFTYLLTLLVVTGLYAQETNTISTEEYRVTYDDSWAANQPGTQGMSFILKTPLKDSTDNFQENINLLIQDVSAYDLDLGSYTEISLDQINSMFEGSEVISSKTLHNDGTKGPYQEVIFTAPNGPYKLKFIQHYYLHKKKAFILTYTAEAKNFDVYLETVTTIMNSFVLK